MPFAEDVSEMKEDGAVYFSYDHAADSFSGILEDAYSLTDDQIKEYIEYDNPALYHRLCGLPFGSDHISRSYHPQLQFRTASEIHAELGSPQVMQKIPEDHAYETPESVPQDDINPEALLTSEMLKLQIKRQVQSSLLNGHSLTLKKLLPKYGLQTCGGPSCISNGVILHDRFYLTLKQGLFPNGYTGLSNFPNETHYCLECLENIFDGVKHEMRGDIGQQVGTSFDGIDHDRIIEAASRIYQANDPGSVQGSRQSSSESRTSDSNTLDRALEIRLKKEQEIKSALQEVYKFERHRSRSQESTEIPVSPDLKIKRPPYMETAKERYKKQGQREWDRRLAIREERIRESLSPKVSPTSYAPQTPDDDQTRVCYCREPDFGDEDLVQCENEWCSIGLFHLRCVEDPDPETGEFWCDFCQDDYGPFHPVMNDNETDEMTVANDMILDEVDQYATDDSGDEDERDEMEIDQDVTVRMTVSPWGTPINLQAVHTTSPTRTTAAVTDIRMPGSPCPKRTERPEQLDGFTPTKSSLKPTIAASNVILTKNTISTPTPSPITPTYQTLNFTISHPPLFPGSSQTTFSDLAPFISTHELSKKANKVFEQWKYDLPPSRLVRALLNMSGHEQQNYDADDAVQDCSPRGGPVKPRLSELLKSRHR